MHWLSALNTRGGVQDVQPADPAIMQVAQVESHSIDMWDRIWKASLYTYALPIAKYSWRSAAHTSTGPTTDAGFTSAVAFLPAKITQGLIT